MEILPKTFNGFSGLTEISEGSSDDEHAQKNSVLNNKHKVKNNFFIVSIFHIEVRAA